MRYTVLIVLMFCLGACQTATPKQPTPMDAADKSTAAYPAKTQRLETLRAQQAKWQSHNISDYELTITQDCFCLYGPAYGPNKVVVKNEAVKIVRYYGEARDNFKPGERLDVDDGISMSVSELFERTERQVINAAENAILDIEYHPDYGFPVLIDYDRPDLDDEESRVTVYGFKPK